jgi:hypothetical protein
MYTIAHGPCAAKYLLNWPATDPSTFLGMVRSLTIAFSNEAANPENPAGPALIPGSAVD